MSHDRDVKRCECGKELWDGATCNCDRSRGAYHKFNVERTDGKSAPGEKHEGCDYFVLDLTHDEFAEDALRAYAIACKDKYPKLSEDLFKMVDKINE